MIYKNELHKKLTMNKSRQTQKQTNKYQETKIHKKTEDEN